MKYKVIRAMTLSEGGVENYRQYRSESVIQEFSSYEEAVEFCKAELDTLREYAFTYEERNPMASEYRPEDAFWNGGGDLRIEPEPKTGEAFNASAYFFKNLE